MSPQLPIASLALAALAFGSLALALARTRSLIRRLHAQTHPLHELRGAITALQLGTALIAREGRSLAEHDHRRGERLSARAEALQGQLERARLAIADLEACRLGDIDRAGAGSTVRFELGSLVLDRASAWAQLAPAYGSRLQASWAAGDVDVIGDRRRIIAMLDNLVANALEHGGGRVTVEGRRAGSDVQVVISDQGRGLPRPLSKTRDAGWLAPRGHGLAIAREVLHAHGGRLAARTGLSGSSVIVQLPADFSAASATRPHGGERSVLAKLARPSSQSTEGGRRLPRTPARAG